MKYFITLICAFFLFFSCDSFFNDKELPGYVVTVRDFENSLKIEGTVEPVNMVIVSCPANWEGTVNSIVEDGTYVEKGEILAVLESPRLATDYEAVSTNLEMLKANLQQIRADLDFHYALLETQVENNKVDTEIALMDSVSLKFATPNQKRIHELELRQIVLQKEKINRRLKSLERIQQTDLRRYELEILRFTNRLESMKEQLDAQTIKAPQKGLALRADYRVTGKKLQIGDVVLNRMPIVMIPDVDTVKVKIKASEVDFKMINIDDFVEFTFDAMPDNRAWGKIRMKSPVGQQYSENSKVKFFEIEASVDSAMMIPDPGLTANCKIILKQVRDTIVIPQIAVNEVDSMRVVFVKKGKDYEMRQIETGLSSPKEVIVSAGIKAGEEVSLIKPEQERIKSRVLLPVSTEKENDETVKETETIQDSIKIENEK